MKKTVILALVITLPFMGRTQFVAPEIIKKYPAAVVSRIYEITLNTLISQPTQLKLANVLYKKDSMVLAAVQAQQSLKKIKTIVDSMQLQFENAFNEDEKVKYLLYENKDYIQANAKLNAAFIKEKYSLSPELEKEFYSIFFSKNHQVLRAIAAKVNSAKLPDSIIRTFSSIDGLHNDYMVVAKGESYFNETIQKLNAIKPLSKTEKEQLRQNFTTQCLRRGNNYNRNFNIAMQSCIKDSNYYTVLYQDSVNALVKQRYKLELDDYGYKYTLSQSALNSISPIVENKVNRNIWLDTRLPFNKKRDSLQAEINETSWDTIKNKLIRQGYTALGKSRFVSAMRRQKMLNLTEIQMDSLASANLQLDLMTYFFKINNNNALPDYSRNERNLLRKILNTGQYDTLIQVEALPQAFANARQNLDDLKKYKLSEGLNSDSLFLKLTDYHTAYLVLMERYYSDPETYKKLVNAAVANKPEILKRLRELQKKEDNVDADELKVLW